MFEKLYQTDSKGVFRNLNFCSKIMKNRLLLCFCSKEYYSCASTNSNKACMGTPYSTLRLQGPISRSTLQSFKSPNREGKSFCITFVVLHKRSGRHDSPFDVLRAHRLPSSTQYRTLITHRSPSSCSLFFCFFPIVDCVVVVFCFISVAHCEISFLQKNPLITSVIFFTSFFLLQNEEGSTWCCFQWHYQNEEGNIFWADWRLWLFFFTLIDVNPLIIDSF